MLRRALSPYTQGCNYSNTRSVDHGFISAHWIFGPRGRDLRRAKCARRPAKTSPPSPRMRYKVPMAKDDSALDRELAPATLAIVAGRTSGAPGEPLNVPLIAAS